MVSRGGGLKDALPWIGALALFLVGGYFLFIKPNMTNTPETAKATATAAPTEAGGGGMLSSMDVASDEESPAATVTPTPSPTVTPTPTSRITYGVFQDGEQISCWCDLETGEIGGGDPSLCGQYPPTECR
jgi:hypothetical protein